MATFVQVPVPGCVGRAAVGKPVLIRLEYLRGLLLRYYPAPLFDSCFLKRFDLAMPFLFTCPHCQAKTQVDDCYSGQSGNCVTCGGPIQLPRFAVGATQGSPPKRVNRFGSASGSRERMLRWVIAGAVGLVFIVSLFSVLFRYGGETVSHLTSNRERAASMRNLERIAAALNAYAADYGTYPPNATRDQSGKKLHSWRVLILPYLGEDELYNQFDLSVPWDDVHHMQVTEIPSVYRHPNGNAGVPAFTPAYFMIVGPGTLMPASGPLSPRQIGDDPAQTILVIEGSPIVPSGYWYEPVDLDITKMRGDLSTNPSIEPGGLLEDGVAFATSDGRAHFVPTSIDPRKMLSLITANGGERLPDDALD